ncbi:MAG: baseplate J/gp47 family protein, partial [Bacteroidota bacterium]
AEVRALHLSKRIETLVTVHNYYRHEVDRGFQKLLEFALGEHFIGDALPALPPGVTDLYLLRTELAKKPNLTASQKAQDPHWQYLERSLYMDFQKLDNLLDIQQRHLLQDPASPNLPNAWQLAYQYLEEAFLRKQSAQRQRALRQIYSENPDPKLGYVAMLQEAFGDPSPGDSLPEYGTEAPTPELLFAHLKSDRAAEKQSAEKYLRDEWSLSPEDFLRIHPMLAGGAPTELEWETITSLVEAAEREQRRIQATKPQREVVGRLYASTNPQEELAFGNQDASHPVWPLFGNDQAPQAQMGLRLASPNLSLSAGHRQIDVYLSLLPDSISADAQWLLDALPDQKSPVIQPSLWVNETGHVPEAYQLRFGHFLFGDPLGQWSATIQNQVLTLNEGPEAFQLLTQVILLDHEGTLWQPQVERGDTDYGAITLVQLPAADRPALRPALAPGKMAVYRRGQVFTHALHFQAEFSVDAPPLVPEAEQPVPELRLWFDPEFTPLEPAETFSWPGLVPLLRDVCLQQIRMEVSVADLPLTAASSDQQELDTQKPFLPFEEPCLPGNSFFFTHPEIASKRLDLLGVDLDWMQAPGDFAEYYQSYPALQGQPLVGAPSTITARLRLQDHNAPFDVWEELELFPAHRDRSPTWAVTLTDALKRRYPTHQYRYHAVDPAATVRAHRRYFSLEYTGDSFGESHYEIANLRFFQTLTTAAPDAVLVKPPEPYVPRLKQVKLMYTASQYWGPDAEALDPHLEVQYLTPFGTRALGEAGNTHLLPYYHAEGESYFCLRGARPGETLSLWFQLADGSGDPDVPKPTMEVEYPTADGWSPLPPQRILRDSTHGLAQTGLVYLQLPTTLHATPELPNTGYWLRIRLLRYAAAVPAAIAVRTHGLLARLAPGSYAADHYLRPLPAQQITELEDAPFEVATIEQPYSSTHGQSAETEEHLYLRASERIRHKQRALTAWDYERLVIDQFADVYKVRCLTADHTRLESPGAVRVVCIPDLRGKTPFDPLQPKLTEARLAQIANYLQQYTPPSALLQVANPQYVSVKARFAVRLLPGYEPTVSVEQLHQAVKQYLAPWAFEEGYEITFGGELYANSLVGFVESLPYVDYVARVRLFRREIGDKYTAIADTDGMYRVEATEPDSILVSAPSHDIDLIGDAGYALSRFEGIDHDKIELDFQVGDD